MGPAVVERQGVRFGFLGFNAIGETPAVGMGRPGAVSVSMPPRTGPLTAVSSTGSWPPYDASTGGWTWWW